MLFFSVLSVKSANDNHNATCLSEEILVCPKKSLFLALQGVSRVKIHNQVHSITYNADKLKYLIPVWAAVHLTKTRIQMATSFFAQPFNENFVLCDGCVIPYHFIYQTHLWFQLELNHIGGLLMLSKDWTLFYYLLYMPCVQYIRPICITIYERVISLQKFC